MQHTGIEKQGKHFIIAWIQKNRPFQCFRVPCHKETQDSYWAQILADSRDCATFAYITPKCLVNKTVQCRGPSASWNNASTLLETAVCRGQPVKELATVSTKPWVLKHADLYSIGKSDSLLLVTVHRPVDND
jgi:hypothetical protein